MSILTKPKPAASLADLIAELLAGVPDLQAPTGPGAEVHRLAALRDELTTSRTRILRELETTSGDGPGGPMSTSRYDAGKDAGALLAGTDIADLTAPAEETARGSLLRQLRAADAALEILQDKIREASDALVASEFARLKPALREIMSAVAERYEQLRLALETLNRLDTELGHKGFPIGRRPSLLGGYDLDTLHGCSGRPSLAWWTNHLRETWGLDKEGK